MKHLKLMMALIASLFLSSCNDAYGQPMDLVVIPVLLFIIGVVLVILAFVERASGTVVQSRDDTTNDIEVREKLPIYKIWEGVAGIALIVISVAIYFYMRAGN